MKNSLLLMDAFHLYIQQAGSQIWPALLYLKA